MKFFSKAKDGGPESPVIGYFLVEIKSLFSIVLLNFTGTREAYHSHAFNAVTIWLKGLVRENVLTAPEDPVEIRIWTAGDVKYTPRYLMHKIFTNTGAWALSFRGPWAKTWQEYKGGERTTLAHGRLVVSKELTN